MLVLLFPLFIFIYVFIYLFIFVSLNSIEMLWFCCRCLNFLSLIINMSL